MLENPANGYLKDDTIIIRYAIELVVSSGGALSRNSSHLQSNTPAVSGSSITVPPPSLGLNMAELLERAEGADVTFKVEDEVFRGHRIVLTARSPVFRALLTGGMRESEDGEVHVPDVRPPVFKVPCPSQLCVTALKEPIIPFTGLYWGTLRPELCNATGLCMKLASLTALSVSHEVSMTA